MWEQYDAITRCQQLGAYPGLVLVDVETGAADRPRSQRRRESDYRTTGPRDVLIRIAVGFIRARAAASIR